MTSSDRPLNVSFLVSLTLHAALAGLWGWLHLQQRAPLIRLESVELMEILKEIPVVPEPAQRAPKTIMEFLKMALPTMRKPELREVQAPSAKVQTRLETAARIDLSRQVELKTAPTLDLSRRPAPVPVAALSEVAPSPSPKDRVVLPVEPSQAAIKLDEVGRRRVAAPPPPAITLGGSRAIALPAAAFREIQPTGPARASSPSPKEVAVAPVVLDRPEVRGGVGRPIAPEALPVGFGRGRVEGLQVPRLADVVQAGARPAGAVMEKSAGARAVEITGPLSQRGVVESFLPVYPDWARRKGVEADVAIRLFVAPDGTVREKMTVERTSGYRELDRLAMEALRRWRFAPVASGGDQWGIVTFRFRLQ